MADYHHGELAVQHRAGLRDPAAGSLRAIRDAVPEAAALFLARQPMIVLGAADASGRLWSTLLTGDPGLLAVPDPRTLTVAARPAADDPLGAVLRESGTRVGMIAIEPATRRRIRLNGVARPEGDGVRIALDQVIGNCPKYLQKREYALLPPDRGGRRTAVRRGEALTTVQQLTLATADSFFIATASPDGDADASHRGGNPGFLQVLSPTRLRWPDYAGNAMFLTLGNLELGPGAGLLVPDWETGDLLQLSGTAHTVWDGAEAAAVPGRSAWWSSMSRPSSRRRTRYASAGATRISRASTHRWRRGSRAVAHRSHRRGSAARTAPYGLRPGPRHRRPLPGPAPRLLLQQPGHHRLQALAVVVPGGQPGPPSADRVEPGKSTESRNSRACSRCSGRSARAWTRSLPARMARTPAV